MRARVVSQSSQSVRESGRAGVSFGAAARGASVSGSLVGREAASVRSSLAPAFLPFRSSGVGLQEPAGGVGHGKGAMPTQRESGSSGGGNSMSHPGLGGGGLGGPGGDSAHQVRVKAYYKG